MDTSRTFTRTCPKCENKDYVFRARKTVEPEPGKQAVETKYLCRGCNHTWKEQQPVPKAA